MKITTTLTTEKVGLILKAYDSPTHVMALWRFHQENVKN
ncbi:hypothetical protein MRBBS_1963 [Marinobacter sp. BSs20148]|nr:hypothetical protein MRBBS_1963 [Marinobacter sp. BSs20148]